MKWYLNWELETKDGEKIQKEDWASSWNEVIGYFNNWMSRDSDVVKGEVICYWDDEPYGDGKPCLYFNIRAEAEENDD